MFQAKTINIDEIISRRNNRHKQHEEQNLKEKEIHQKQLEKRQNMKTSKFCNFCDKYQANESHFCSLFQKWIRVDSINLVFIEGASQNDVEPTANDGEPKAKDGQTKSSRIIKAYPNKTSMFNDLLSLKQIKIKVKSEMAEKLRKKKATDNEKKMVEENPNKMNEKEGKKKQEEMKRQQEEEENKQRKKEMEKEQKMKEEYKENDEVTRMGRYMQWKFAREKRKVSKYWDMSVPGHAVQITRIYIPTSGMYES